jgi:nucleoid DNA-binding protein
LLKRQITKLELYRRLAEHAGVSEDAAAKVLEELSRVAAAEASANGGFLLAGIGIIESTERFERTSVNPMTGEEIKVGPSVKLKFQFSWRFKKAVETK